MQDKTLRRLLDVALDGRRAFRRFKDVLADLPAERERWFEFRAERMHQHTWAWLEDNELAPADEE